MASVSDCVEKVEHVTVLYSRIVSVIGCGVMFAPLMSNVWLTRVRNRSTDLLALSVVWNAISTLEVLCLKETLPVAKRKPFKFKIPNPFTFVKLFISKSKELSIFAWLYMLLQT